jgi:hypothetical protein
MQFHDDSPYVSTQDRERKAAEDKYNARVDTLCCAVSILFIVFAFITTMYAAYNFLF